MSSRKWGTKNGGQDIWIWIFIDRNRNKVIDFQIGNRSKHTYIKVANRIKDKYNINYFCTDHYESYTSFTLANKKHIQSKTETSLIECVNSRIRNYLARFNRRTKRYSKSIEMIECSLYLLFDKCTVPHSHGLEYD